MRIVTITRASRFVFRARPLTSTFATLTTRRFGTTATQLTAYTLTNTSKATGEGFDTASQSFSVPASKKNDTNENNMAPAKLELKTPKGTKDWDGKAIILREQIFNTSELARFPPFRTVLGQ